MDYFIITISTTTFDKIGRSDISIDDFNNLKRLINTYQNNIIDLEKQTNNNQRTISEQQKIIDNQKREIDRLKSQLSQIQKDLDDLKRKLR